MGCVKLPRTLRTNVGVEFANENGEGNSKRKIAVGCLIAVASVTGAKAQSPLAPVTVDAPVERKKPVVSKSTPEQIRARNALRRAAREKQAQQAQAAAAAANTAAQEPDHDPYADPNAPYKANRLSSAKFPEPIVNTPRSITVLTKELLEDKDATSLKEVARTTPGITLGTGEGGNAFGDRFFIRGFDARNDVFVDGIRDPAVSVRENFFTEQLEILKGPAATIDGRGTTGGALNIVTKQAANTNFYNTETTIAGDGTRRVTLDVNQVINPTLAVRVDGVWQNAGVAGRNYTTDNRDGGMAAVKWAPNDSFTVTANYVHTNLWSLPDFGVPYNNILGAPVTSLGVPRDTWYGVINRDFQKVQQDFGTVDSKYIVNDFITLENKVRDEKSVLNYIGTIPEQSTSCGGGGMATTLAGLNPAGWTACLNAQSRYQVTNVVADQQSATFKFDTGPVRNTIITGAEVSREQVSIDTYGGLGSEAVGNVFANGSIGPVSVLDPTVYENYSGTPTPTGNPDVIAVNTQSAYSLWTANYRDYVILNAGVRFDETGISAKKMYNSFPSTAEVSGGSGMWNYNLGALWKPIPITSLYWAYATASDPLGAELDGTSTNYGGLNPTFAGSQVFSPIESRAQEVGNKWELFDRRLLATIALFRTDVSNARELIGSSSTGTIIQGAAYHVQGIDMGAEGNIADKWSVYTGLVLMKTRVDHSATPSNIGLPLAFISPQSFNVLTKYKITDNFEVGGQATYRSAMQGGTLLAANAGTTLPSYWRFDTFVDGKIYQNWRWKLFANNIFNKLYYDAFYQSGAPFVLVAPGRVLGMELAAKF
ncbi:MAG TPA: TonB-dependent receptor [Xanthobacteraceae bacterium]|jgi:catecholate siderophore receptor|nr:TonB-dependent receptor [Xanthobacteraceae bacterium]